MFTPHSQSDPIDLDIFIFQMEGWEVQIYCGGVLLSCSACLWLWEIVSSLTLPKERTWKSFFRSLFNLVIFIMAVFQALKVVWKLITLLGFIMHFYNPNDILEAILHKEPTEVQMYMAKIALWIVNLI